MALEHWHLVALLSAATGITAFTVRLALQVWEHWQMSRLDRQGRLLERWWAVIADLPPEMLSNPVRRAIGGMLLQHLQRARRLQPNHPYLRAQREQIARFIGQAPTRAPRLRGVQRQQAISAVTEFTALLNGVAADRLVSHHDIVRCRAAAARTLTELEFLQRQQSALTPEHMRRVTRAIDSANRLWGSQLPASNSRLPTQ